MSDDFEDDRPSRKPAKKSGDNTLKIVLIVFGSIAGLGLLTCCGVGAGAYFWAKKQLAQIALTAPADIQKLTAEMTDITIPAEFVAKEGTSIFGIKSVQYEWCPTGTCPTRTDGLGTLKLTSINLGDTAKDNPDLNATDPSQFTEEFLKHEWRDFTRTEHEFDIRGKKCKFYIVQGEHTGFVLEDEDSETMPQQPAATSDDEAETPAETATSDEAPPATPPAQVPAGRKTVRVAGSFPGKEAECMLEIHLSPEEYDEEKILGMLRSIK